MSDFVSFEGPDDPAYTDSVRQFAARRGVYATTHDVAALGRDLYALTPADGRWESAEAMARRLPVALGDALEGYRDGYGRCCFRLPRPHDFDDDGAFTPGDVDELSEARFEDWAAALASVRAFVERTTGNSATSVRVIDLLVDVCNVLGLDVKPGAGERFARTVGGRIGLDKFEALVRRYPVGSVYRWGGEALEDEGESRVLPRLDGGAALM